MSDLGWYGRTSYDRRQNEELDNLAGQLSYQREEAQRLKATLSRVQGGLEQRLGRLATAFDAFVELSDLREELRVFEPAATARRRARRVVLQLRTADTVPDGLTPPPPGDSPPEAFGYWLPSALAGLVATVRGEVTTAEAELAAARACDPTRTDLFLCLALLLTGRVEQAGDHLGPLLDLPADRPVTRAQRELWLAAADGRFGETGRTTIADRLVAVMAALPDGTRATQVIAWRSLVEGLPQDGASLPAVRKPVEIPASLVAPIRAANQLAALAGWYARRGEGPAATSTRAEAEGTEPTDSPPDPLASLLEELVDEGAPDEQALLKRVAELRRVIQGEGGGTPSPPTPWHGSVEPAHALLLADAGSGSAGRRTVALRAATPLLAAVADDLLAAARQAPPEQVDVAIGRRRVRYGPAGPDAASVAEVQAATLASPPPPQGRRTRIAWSLLAAGAITVGLGFAAGLVGLGLVVGALVAGTGGWLLYDVARVRADAEAGMRFRDADWDRIQKQIGAVTTVVSGLREQAGRSAADAAANRARLDELVAAAEADVETPAPASRPASSRL